MSTLEQRLRDSFDAVVMPSGLREKTLATIREERQKTGIPPQARVHRRPSLVRRGILALAACLMLCVVGFGGYSVYATETALVGIEVNPSIELGVNQFDVVIAARAYNPDGQQVLDEVSVIGKSYVEALQVITGSTAFLKYVDDTSLVDISVVCENDRQSATLMQESETTIATLPCEGMCNRVSEEDHLAAAEAGMGVGRYEAAQALISLDTEITLQDCQSMSMKEIRQRIEQIDPANSYAWHGSGARGGHGQGGSGMYCSDPMAFVKDISPLNEALEKYRYGK